MAGNLLDKIYEIIPSSFKERFGDEIYDMFAELLSEVVENALTHGLASSIVRFTYDIYQAESGKLYNTLSIGIHSPSLNSITHHLAEIFINDPSKLSQRKENLLKIYNQSKM